MTAHITIDGNLAADPEFGVADSGKSWARLRVASHERLRQRDGSWSSGPAQYYQVALFDQAAEQASNDLHKGDPVTVTGRLDVEEFERRDGTTGTALKVYAREVGKTVRGPGRTGRSVTLDGDTDITVNNPDDPFDPPLYEGPAQDAHTVLAPGMYRAAYVDDQENIIQARLTVTSTRSAATRTAPSAPPTPAGEPTVHHTPTGTAITGVSRDDVQVQAALKQAGFKWSAPRSFWFLPQSLDEQTRALRVAGVQADLAALNVTVQVTDQAPTVSKATGAAPKSESTAPAAEPEHQVRTL